jgi:ABC-2 type transport system permease protein
MRKVYVVAMREYLAAVRTKAFVIGLVMMPLLMTGSLAAQRLFKDFRDTADKRFAVVDRTPDGWLLPAVEAAVKGYNDTQLVDPQTGKQVQPRFAVEAERLSDDSPAAVDEARARLSDRVRGGELLGFLEIGPDVGNAGAPEERRQVRYQTNRPTQVAFPHLAESTITAAVQARRGKDLGLDPARVRELIQPVGVVSKGLSARDAAGRVVDATESSRLAPVFLPMALMMLMFMGVIMGATPLMQGVVEEKMQRIAEVLLGSVRPFELMLGKLLGMAAVSLTMSAVYLGGAYWAAAHYGVAEYISPGLLAWFVVFQALAALMFGSLFIAVGAACTDMKETQSMLWPIILLATLPMFFLVNILQEPNSPVAAGLSFFPFATPSLMVARMAVPPGVPLWQPVLGVAVVLATTLACVWAAARIFRVGILLQGKGANFVEMARWVVRG